MDNKKTRVECLKLTADSLLGQLRGLNDKIGKEDMEGAKLFFKNAGITLKDLVRQFDDPMTPAGTAFADMIEKRQDEQLLALAAESPNRCDSQRLTPLEAAVAARRADLCRTLLGLGCDPDFSRTGTDPLERCLQLPGEPPLDILALLLERSRHPVCDQRPSGVTLLHGAVAWGCLAAVPFLMSRGARLSDMDIDCETVAQTALETGGEPLLARLREMEAAATATAPAT